MKPTIKFYESAEKRLTLEVISSLQNLNGDAVQPLWDLLEKTSLTGDFKLFVNRKIPGSHLDHSAAVKVSGLTQLLNYVAVKFQCSPEYCYDGTLSCRHDGNGEESRLPPSQINQELQSVAGRSWYNPNESISERRAHVVSSQQQPLVSLGDALGKSIDPRTEPSSDTPPDAEKREDMLSLDQQSVIRIFKDISEKLRSRYADSADVSDAILMCAYGTKEGIDRRKCGPIIRAWIRKGLLICTEKKGSKRIYRIIDGAIQTFGLDIPNVQLALERDTKEKKTPPRKDVISLGGTLVSIQEKAVKLLDAEETARTLDLERLTLEDRLKTIQNQRDQLKSILEDDDLRRAKDVWLNISDYIKQTEER